MTYILNIETSGEVCSVAISENGKVLLSKEVTEKNSHSAKLAPLTNDIFKTIDLKPKQLQAIAISQGPGSYTGLRIGVSFVKGLSYSLNIPLIAIDTLKLMCIGVLENYILNEHILLCPMIDARRMEIYTALYDILLNQKTKISHLVLNECSFEKYKDQTLLFFGSGMNKWKTIVSENLYTNFYFIENILPKADYMAHLSYQLFNEKKFVDVAYFEPYYLKEFIAGISTKNRIL